MSFDKVKTMRNAERFLTQGKIRAAIIEYKKIVEANPKDFSTLNILGDLNVKNSDEDEAIDCYMLVAEHYNQQGFANKAIAIYNKILRLKPDLPKVSGQLAQLYQARGSKAEARSHYMILADNYLKTGRKIEALAILRQIAEIDSKNTDVFLKIAETCLQEHQKDDAAEAFSEAGLRFCKQTEFEPALIAFEKALAIKPLGLDYLPGYVESAIDLGLADKAAETLEKVLVDTPYDLKVLHLLADCYLALDNTVDSERVIFKIIEQDKSSYPQLLKLVEINTRKNDLEAAARVLTTASDNLLGGGQDQELLNWTNEILARNPEQLDALRLLVRYTTWKRDAGGVQNSLERLAEAAHSNEVYVEEKNALTQLLLMYPQESKYAQRIQELKTLYNFEETEQVDKFSDMQGFTNHNGSNQEILVDENNIEELEDFEGDFQFVEDDLPTFKPESIDPIQTPDETKSFAVVNSNAQFTHGNSEFEDSLSLEDEKEPEKMGSLSAVDDLRLHKEIESIEFYIAQDYIDIAVKSLLTVEEEFGQREELAKFRERLAEFIPDQVEETIPELIEETEPVQIEEVESNQFEETENFEIDNVDEIQETILNLANETPSSPPAKNENFFDELRLELGVDDTEENIQSDYDTHYHTAIAYKEMGLTDDAIKEFQIAINLVEINDGTRRFFKCATFRTLFPNETIVFGCNRMV